MSRDIQALFNKIQLGDRVALGQVMTLVESDLAVDRQEAVDILELCEQKISPGRSVLSLCHQWPTWSWKEYIY
jgi:putative protein kinase ArgK-like GTPase of G3E family